MKLKELFSVINGEILVSVEQNRECLYCGGVLGICDEICPELIIKEIYPKAYGNFITDTE